MKRTISIAMFSMLALFCGCRSANPVPVTSQLDWSVSPTQAYTYSLDGKAVGDYASLKRHLAGLPRGSTINVGPYSEGRGYHFDKLDLRKHCEKHGIQLGIPLAE